MACYFSTASGSVVCEWRVGQKMPAVCAWAEYKTIRNSIATVQADGDELQSIRGQITGLRDALNRRVVTFVGDDAQFIAANLL